MPDESEEDEDLDCASAAEESEEEELAREGTKRKHKKPKKATLSDSFLPFICCPATCTFVPHLTSNQRG